jgi:copper chaperone CopZ
MKNILFVLLLCSKMGYAQFTKAELKASGLTCSMCNLATQKQLQSINFIDSIVPDLELNTFHIYFKSQSEIDFGLIKKKVEDAGFFVAELKVYYNTYSAYRISAPLLFLENAVLFIDNFNDKKETQIYKFIDEGFLTSKELKKYRKIKSNMVLSSNSKDIPLLINKKMYYVVAE